MYKQIKKLADEAIAIQNKDRMDAALREISTICSLASAEGASLVGYVAPETPNPVVLDGSVGEIVAPCAEADTYMAAHSKSANAMAAAAGVANRQPGKKGGAK